jgi:hypothetical protein
VRAKGARPTAASSTTPATAPTDARSTTSTVSPTGATAADEVSTGSPGEPDGTGTGQAKPGQRPAARGKRKRR